MVRKSHLFAVVVGLLAGAGGVAEALAQKPGGILRIPARDSPARLSVHQESTLSNEGPMMAVFNNLVIFDQHVPQNSLQSIVPDLATSWSWSDDGTGLSFPLRKGVKWPLRVRAGAHIWPWNRVNALPAGLRNSGLS